MRRRFRRGASAIEFAFALLVLIPLLLGTMALGFSMLHQLQVVQLGRDAGSMFARKVDFTTLGSQNMLSRIAGSLGLTAGTGAAGTTTGTAVVILSAIQYVNASVCAQASPPLAANTSSCPNFGSWVFTKRVVVGNNTLHTSALGTPDSTVTVSSTDGSIAINDQCKLAGDLVTGYNPWTSSTIAADALAIIQVQPIYVSEAAGYGFRIPPFSSGTKVFSQVYF